ncbi:hypothetical protein BT96DRAFT_969176 [Gymnopus androsaceus JB14]|uniref:Cyclin N-terminal domain-containing protein n=1 Tax=Gymnopus androsaceus JB14 TaxID=1447944 RepID=A0A6A4IQ24_9AGAR|nr:hypothetical protein BT96DRAFT_969176 [Gymnopus androsaceus JB14]
MMSSTSSSSPSRLNRSSPAKHSPSPYLLQLLNIEISEFVIDYIVNYVSHVVEYSVDVDTLRLDSLREKSFRKSSSYNVYSLGSLAYIDRVRPHLKISCSSNFASERVFLGALIVATKYLNDSSMKNIHWARIVRVYSDKDDVSRIEREILEVLDWELRLTEDDLLAHYDILILAAFPEVPVPSTFSSNTCPGPVLSRDQALIPTLMNRLTSSIAIPYPSPSHPPRKRHSPAHLPLVAHSNYISPLPESPSHCALSKLSDLSIETDSSPECDSLNPSQPVTPSDDHSLYCDDKDSEPLWDTFFANMRLLEDSSSPLVERGRTTIEKRIVIC